jgi:DNA-binding transcriptional regulator YiaG
MENTEIAKIRRWFGYDVKEMGARIGAHYTTVSMLETGKRKPTEAQLKALESLRKLARAEMLKELTE